MAAIFVENEKWLLLPASCEGEAGNVASLLTPLGRSFLALSEVDPIAKALSHCIHRNMLKVNNKILTAAMWLTILDNKDNDNTPYSQAHSQQRSHWNTDFIKNLP